MPVVLITPEVLLDSRGPHVAILEEAGFEVRYPVDRTLGAGRGSEDQTIRELQGAEAIIAAAEFLTSRVIAALPHLRVIARLGVGYDRVDVAAATEHQIPVTITPTANHESVAELALALLFAVAKSIVVHDAQVRAGNWRTTECRPLRESTFGVLGLGRIGRSTAVRAAALGMKVIAMEPNPDADFMRRHDIEQVDFDGLLARSDYLSIHCPLNAQTQGLFNRDVFRRMKPGSVLINTARGQLVVESDLIEALQHGPLRAAGLDVFEQEPPLSDNPLLRMENVVLTPHMAGIDTLSIRNMAIEAAGAIVQLYQGEWPAEAVVNQELSQGWTWKATS